MRRQRKNRNNGYGSLRSGQTSKRGSRRGSSRRRIPAAFFVILAVVLLVVCGFQYRAYSQEKKYRAAGIKSFQAGDYKAAQKNFEEALEHKNLFGIRMTKDVKYYLAESLYQQEKYKSAAKVYDELIAHDKDKGILYCLKGACQAKDGETDAAKANFLKAKKLGEMKSLHFLSKMYYDLGDYDKAVSYEEKYIEKNPEEGISYIILSKGYCEQGKYKKALNAIDKGLALKNESEKQALSFQRIVIYEKMLDFDSAYEACKKYVNTYPNDTAAKQELEFLESR